MIAASDLEHHLLIASATVPMVTWNQLANPVVQTNNVSGLVRQILAMAKQVTWGCSCNRTVPMYSEGRTRYSSGQQRDTGQERQ